MKGYSETTAFQEVPAGTTPSIMNVVFLDPDSQRFRISQRAGTALYDLFDFNIGSTISIPSILVSGDGGVGTGSQAAVQVQINACDAFTVGTNASTISICDVIGGTLTVDTASGISTVSPISGTDGSCSNVSIMFCSQPNNNTTSNSGPISIGTSPGGGGSSTTFTQPPCVPSPSNPCTYLSDPNRPWLAVYPCSEFKQPHPGGVSFWIFQSITGALGALPVLLDNNTASATFGQCLYVSGQTTDEPGTNTRFNSDFTIFTTCENCTSSHKSCIYVFQDVYNCTEGSWNGVEYVGVICANTASISHLLLCGSGATTSASANQWVLCGTTSSYFSGATDSYLYRQFTFSGTAANCSTTVTCAGSDSVLTPTTPAFVPPSCSNPCGANPFGFTLHITPGPECSPYAAGDYHFTCTGTIGGSPVYAVDSYPSLPGYAFENGGANLGSGAFKIELSWQILNVGGFSDGFEFSAEPIGVTGPLEGEYTFTLLEQFNFYDCAGASCDAIVVFDS